MSITALRVTSDAATRSDAWVAPGERADADTRIGEPCGRYWIHSLLAAGGHSRVYAAHDAELDRWVALKIVEPRSPVRARGSEEHGHRATRSDVLREARAMARLSHPNLVSVFEIGEDGDAIFIAMELVAGRTLRAWLAEGPRGVRETVAVFAAAGRGLAAAHAGGIVHGDFKPDNVIVEPNGRVRVIDFSLARPLGAVARESRFAGTPRYMAPEQFLGQPLCDRSDQFAFCCALYRALYGEWAFAGSTIAEIAFAVLHTRARRPARRRGSRLLERALLTGLEADRYARHPSMDALLDALDRETARPGLLARWRPER